MNAPRPAAKASLALRSLHLHFAPGVKEGAVLSDLAPGLNIIYGLNGAGKSTLCRAVQSLLWPALDRHREALLSAEVQLADRVLAVEPGSRELADVPLPAVEIAPCYLIALHELLDSDPQANRSEALSSLLLRQMTGGVDLAELERRNKFGSLPDPTGSRRELEAARTEVDELTRRQKGLLARQSRLEEKRKQLEKCKDAGRQLKVCVAETRLVEALAAAQAAGEELRRHPALMAQLRKDDAARLAELEERIVRESAALAEAARRETEAQAAEAGCRLPESGVTEEDERLLQQLVKEIDEATADWRRLEEEKAGCEGETQAALKQIEKQIRPEQAENLTSDVLRDYRELAEKHQQAKNRQEAAAAAAQAPETEAVEIDRLREAANALRQWLRIPEPQPEATGGGRIRWFAIAAFFLLAAAGAFIGWRHGAAGYLLAAVAFIAAVALVFFDAGKGRTAAAEDPRLMPQRAFGALQLDPPREWKPEAVLVCLSELERKIAAAEVAAAQRRLAESRQAEAARLLAEQKSLHARLEDFAGRHALPLLEDPAGLFLLAEGIARWQRAHGELAGRKKSVETMTGRLRQAQAALEERLGRAGLTSSEAERSARSAAELGRLLLERVRRWRQARQEKAAAAAARRQGEAVLARSRQDREAIIDRLGLAQASTRAAACRFCNLAAATDEKLVAVLVDQLPGYGAAVSALNHARTRAETYAEEYRRTCADLGEPAADHAAMRNDGARVQARLAALNKRNAELAAENVEEKALEQEINELLGDIREAGGRHELEKNLETEARALTALLDKFDERVTAAAGGLLIAFLKQEAGDWRASPVFKRANELFASITNGEYALAFEQAPGEKAKEKFKAVETANGRPKDLSELSSGTQVQLLLAARLGFIEATESRYRLPLLLDEAGANSDDLRAAKLAATAVRIAQDGRQVFYFTARQHEAASWLAVARAAGLAETRVIDLGQARFAGEAARPPLVLASVPAPAGMTHAEYGAKLNVPWLDPWDEDGAGLHAWYLFADPGQVQRLLLLGLRSFGQLRSLAAELVPGTISEAEWRHAQAAARIGGVAARIRRGARRPVDEAVVDRLIESKIFAKKQKTALMQAIAGSRGEGAAFLAALRSKEAGVRIKDDDQLTAVLQERQCLDDETVPGYEALLKGVMRECGAEIKVVGEAAAATIVRGVAGAA